MDIALSPTFGFNQTFEDAYFCKFNKIKHKDLTM